MSVNGTVEKKATTEAERAKYIKAAILAAVGGAGIGAIMRSRKANKVRAKEGNPETAHNTIIVPIKKTKFLEELPTPRELAESRGEQLGQASNGGAGKPADAEAAAEAGSVGTSGSETLTPEQIAAKKKEIIGNGRKFNFFGKRAAAKTAQTGEAKKEDPKSGDEKDKGEKGEKKEDEGRTLFRDQEGKFVSSTDPVAVAQSEKDAFPIKNLLAPAIHPIDTLVSNAGAIFDKPVLGTVGALGSIYLAAKISDAINERRRAKAKERLERARAEYIGILEGDEKKAEVDIDLRTTPGTVLGTAFFVPMAAAALVTSKIIENRKIEKKKQKEMSDSYPDDPIILYKTSAAKEMHASVGSILATIAVYKSVMKSAESNGTDVFIKAAQSVDGFQNLRDTFSGIYSNPENYDLISDLIEDAQFNGGKRRNEILTNLADRYAMSGGLALPENGATPTIGGRYVVGKNGFGAVNPTVLGNLGLFQGISSSPEDMEKFYNAVMLDPRTRDSTVRMFNSDNAKAQALKKRLVNEGFENSWIGKTFNKGSVLRSIFEWLAKTFGFTERGFNDRLNGYFDRYSQKSAPNGPAQPPVSPTANAVKQTDTSNAIQRQVNQVPQTPTAGKPAAPAPVVNTPVQSLKTPSIYDKKYLKTDGTIDTGLWNKDFMAWKNQGDLK